MPAFALILCQGLMFDGRNLNQDSE